MSYRTDTVDNYLFDRMNEHDPELVEQWLQEYAQIERPGPRRVGLTSPENAVLTFIVDYIEERGYPPSIADISGAVGRSRSTVHSAVQRLQRKGWISIEPGQPRSLRVVAS